MSLPNYTWYKQFSLCYRSTNMKGEEKHQTMRKRKMKNRAFGWTPVRHFLVCTPRTKRQLRNDNSSSYLLVFSSLSSFQSLLSRTGNRIIRCFQHFPFWWTHRRLFAWLSFSWLSKSNSVRLCLAIGHLGG